MPTVPTGIGVVPKNWVQAKLGSGTKISGSVRPWKMNGTTGDIISWGIFGADGVIKEEFTDWKISDDGLYIVDNVTGKIYKIEGKLDAGDCPCRVVTTKGVMFLTPERHSAADIEVPVVRQKIVCDETPTKVEVPCDEDGQFTTSEGTGPATNPAGTHGLGNIDYLAEAQLPDIVANILPYQSGSQQSGGTIQVPFLPGITANGGIVAGGSISTEKKEEEKGWTAFQIFLFILSLAGLAFAIVKISSKKRGG